MCKENRWSSSGKSEADSSYRSGWLWNERDRRFIASFRASSERLRSSEHLGNPAIGDAGPEILSSPKRRNGARGRTDSLFIGLPMVRRAEALAALMQFKKGIVIAGMHGKTTTSSMTAHIMRVGGLNPSHYVGAEIPILGTNAHWEPNGGYLVAEGDESDGTLSFYHAEHAIILNIEEEHLDYYADLTAIEKVFNRFLDQVTGKVVYCADDPHAARL